MGYLGAVGPAYDPTRATVPQFDAERFNGDNSTVAFTLLRQVVSPTDVEVFVENVRQEPIVAYSIVNGTTLTFTEAPQTGTNNIYVIYRGSGVSNYAFVPDGSISYAKLANNIRQFNVDNFSANGTGQTFTLSETPATANTVIVAIDGVVQTAPKNYSIAGSTIIFDSAPAASANVTVRHLGFRTTTTVTALSAASVTATELADGAVTNAKLAGSITSDKISSVSGASLIANTIAVNTVSGNVIVANTVSNSAFARGSVENYMRAQGSSSVFAGMRNRIINGAMTIDQRNAGASITPVDGSFLCDRWKVGLTQSAKFSGHTQSTIVPPNYGNALKIVSNSAYSVTSSDEFSLFQGIEGYNVDDLGFGAAGAKTVTLSFWVRSSLTGTFGGSLKSAIASRSYTFPYTIVAADTWEQKFITIPGDTTGNWTRNTNANSFQLFFSLGQGSNGLGTANTWQAADLRGVTGQVNLVGTNGATWYLGGVQLEAGSTATPFEFRQYGTELALCQRYGLRVEQQQNTGDTCSTGTNANVRFTFPVTMRASPTASLITAGSWIVGNGFSANYTAASVSIVSQNLSPSAGRVNLGGFPTFGSNFFVSGSDAVGTAVMFMSAEI
jgi:hypothetical protein